MAQRPAFALEQSNIWVQMINLGRSFAIDVLSRKRKSKSRIQFSNCIFIIAYQYSS